MDGHWVFYRTADGPAFHFCSEWRKKKRRIAEALTVWARQQGANSFIPGTKGWAYGGWAINALSGDGPPPKGWRISKTPTSDGRPRWVPDKRAAEGRGLEKQMKEMEALPSPDEFCTAYGFPHSIEYHGKQTVQGFVCTSQYRAHTCQIGWVKNEFWVLLPDVDAMISDYEERGFTVDTPRWTPPSGLRRATQAEYELAVAQEKVERERERKAA